MANECSMSQKESDQGGEHPRAGDCRGGNLSEHEKKATKEGVLILRRRQREGHDHAKVEDYSFLIADCSPCHTPSDTFTRFLPYSKVMHAADASNESGQAKHMSWGSSRRGDMQGQSD